ncbi:MAG: hypothetical protein MUC28_00450 [Planctomycetes bacterium]|nr:hypothetical protein [Planctomycetota bacterium]
MNIFFGLLLMAAGGMIVAKSEWMLSNFGRIEFFDKYLGSSGPHRRVYRYFGYDRHDRRFRALGPFTAVKE